MTGFLRAPTGLKGPTVGFFPKTQTYTEVSFAQLKKPEYNSGFFYVSDKV